VGDTMLPKPSTCAAALSSGTTGQPLDLSFRALFERSPIGMALASLDNRFLEVNQAFAGMLGYAPQELAGKAFTSITHPEDVASSLAATEQALGGPDRAAPSLRVEKRYLHRGGQVLRVVVSAFMLRDAAGHPSHWVAQVIDVTEQRRLEAALHEGAEQLRLAVRHAPGPIAVHAEDGEILFLSDGWLRSSGYRAEELRTMRDWVSLAYGDLAEERLASIHSLFTRAVGRPEDVLALETRIRSADGSRRIWSFTSAPIGLGPDGRRLAVSMARDVTAERAAQAELRESERRYRLLAENVSDVLWTYDLAANRFTYVSPSVERLRGLTVAEALVEPLQEALTPASLARVLEISARVGEPGGLGPPRGASALTVVLEQPCRGGPVKQVEMTLTPILDEAGRIVGTQGVSRDVTARVRALQAEQSARQEADRSLAILRGVIETSPSAIFSIDRDYRYTAFNSVHAAIMLALYRAEITPGASLLEAMTIEEDRRKAKANLDRALAGEVVVEEAHSGEAARDRRYFEVTHHPVRDAAGAIIGAAVFARDLTGRRHAELALEEAVADLRRSNADLERFAYAASHDLQEPLRMVASFLQLLERRAGSCLDAEAREFLGFATSGASRMQVLVADLLAFSRAGREATPSRAVATDEALDQALGNLGVAIQEAGALVKRAPLPPVQGIHSQVVQVFQNLVSNALKFHGGGAPRVEIDAVAEGASWHFRVRDQGIGIDPQYFDRIFQLFQRLHGHERFEGTGIGLAITKRLVERLGGRIWVESAPGAGATFHFTLPAPAGGGDAA